MESHFDWEPNVVPADWTAEKDLEEFIARFGEPQDYFGEAMARVEDGVESLNEALDRGLSYFGVEPACLSDASIPGKVSTLEGLIGVGLKPEAYREGSLTQDYRDRFEEDFRYCRRRWADYQAIMPRYDSGREDNWLILLAKCASLIFRRKRESGGLRC
jgi:hypothetical protein